MWNVFHLRALRVHLMVSRAGMNIYGGGGENDIGDEEPSVGATTD